MTRDNALRTWKRTPTPEVEAEINRLQEEALGYGYELELSDLFFLAFYAGLKAATASDEHR
jgi:hypothetical protein